jgi:regulator of protease activity HflC (stomatin/prohibitin superfamily)
MEDITLIIGLTITLLFVLLVARTAIIVPQQFAYVVERLGRYNKVLGAGFHILMPLIDVIKYKHNLKEVTLDTPEQECITKDNVNVKIDAILYYKILDPVKSSYGVDNYLDALSELAQTTLRSEVGRLEMDKIFEERGFLNRQIVGELDKASEPWGIKVMRFEIQKITPPSEILDAMEKQVRAEREKRATILSSEGRRDALINQAEAEKVQTIKSSEAELLKQVNEAKGQATAIKEIAEATAQGIERIAAAIRIPGGVEATQLKLASQYIDQFGHLAKESNTMILPGNFSDVGSILALANKMLTNKSSVNLFNSPVSTDDKPKLNEEK